MLNIPLMDATLCYLKEEAENDSFYALHYLATCLSRAMHMPRDEVQALKIFDYIIAERHTLPDEHRSLYWESLIEKAAIARRQYERGERESYEEEMEQLYLEMIQDMTRVPVRYWNRMQLSCAAQYLHNFELLQSEE